MPSGSKFSGEAPWALASAAQCQWGLDWAPRAGIARQLLGKLQYAPRQRDQEWFITTPTYLLIIWYELKSDRLNCIFRPSEERQTITFCPLMFTPGTFSWSLQKEGIFFLSSYSAWPDPPVHKIPENFRRWQLQTTLKGRWKSGSGLLVLFLFCLPFDANAENKACFVLHKTSCACQHGHP